MQNTIEDINFYLEFSKKLRYQIFLSGKSKTKVAQEVGITPATITTYCNSQVKKCVPQLDSLYRLCKSLNCALSDLVPTVVPLIKKEED